MDRFRVITGRLPDGRPGALIFGTCISALGDYHYMDLWARDPAGYGGAVQLAEHRFPRRGSPRYRELVAQIGRPKVHRFDSCVPLHVFRKLVWT